MSDFPKLAGLRMDRVFTYADQLSFLIPHEWEEVDESNEYYCYEEPGDEGGIGWLRVSLITGTTKDSEEESERLQKDAKNLGRQFWRTEDNIVQQWQEYSEREGDPICNSYWTVTRVLREQILKTALFTYTVASGRLREPRTQQMIRFLGEIFAKAEFSLPVAAPSGH